MTYLESILETLKTLSPETESHAFVAFSLKTELGWRLAIDENNVIHVVGDYDDIYEKDEEDIDQDTDKKDRNNDNHASRILHS